MLKSRPRLKKIGLLVALLFIVLQVHSFWAFRYRFENYFYDKVFSEEFEDNILLQMSDPLSLSHKSLFATLKYLFQYSDNTAPDGMTKISNKELYHFLRGQHQSYVKSSENMSYGYNQITLENCPSLSVTNECHRIYTIYDNVVCSFRSEFEIKIGKINCRYFYQKDKTVYSTYINSTKIVKSTFAKKN